MELAPLILMRGSAALYYTLIVRLRSLTVPVRTRSDAMQTNKFTRRSSLAEIKHRALLLGFVRNDLQRKHLALSFLTFIRKRIVFDLEKRKRHNHEKNAATNRHRIADGRTPFQTDCLF